MFELSFLSELANFLTPLHLFLLSFISPFLPFPDWVLPILASLKFEAWIIFLLVFAYFLGYSFLFIILTKFFDRLKKIKFLKNLEKNLSLKKFGKYEKFLVFFIYAFPSFSLRLTAFSLAFLKVSYKSLFPILLISFSLRIPILYFLSFSILKQKNIFLLIFLLFFVIYLREFLKKLTRKL